MYWHPPIVTLTHTLLPYPPLVRSLLVAQKPPRKPVGTVIRTERAASAATAGVSPCPTSRRPTVVPAGAISRPSPAAKPHVISRSASSRRALALSLPATTRIRRRPPRFAEDRTSVW